ncbi:MAG: electron transfer flavoprotein subunit beta/FixA family protein [Planctomycetales bacterium]|nr:electron transfer flavoprotein subunit beta/FixA family protein [bacterium]UNM07879.1 MAG: electron transfer flavoprotein subunit beta/FixA family protein [Planctomycetales bacterium]
MKIVVIVKEVPDTEAKITINGGKPDLSGVKMIINPYDEYAVEEAIQQADKLGDSSVTVVMIGDDNSKKNLTNVLALGAEDAILVKDAALAGSDPLQLAKVLKAAIEPLGAGMVLAGRQGVDHDWGMTGIALAELLGWGHVGLITGLEISGDSFKATSDGDNGKMTFEGSLPAVFTTDKGINEPRYASLKGIMAAKKKTVAEKSLADLGLDAAVVGGAAAKVSFVGADLPPQKQPGRIIDGDSVQAKVATLVDALRNEAKVI